MTSSPVQLFNLTPHPVDVWDDDDPMGSKLRIPASGLVARLAVEEYGDPPADFAAGGVGMSELLDVPVVAVSYGQLEFVDTAGLGLDPVRGLPDEVDGVFYVVSLPVSLACPRADFLVPYREVRNDAGTIVGCKALARVVV